MTLGIIGFDNWIFMICIAKRLQQPWNCTPSGTLQEDNADGFTSAGRPQPVIGDPEIMSRTLTPEIQVVAKNIRLSEEVFTD